MRDHNNCFPLQRPSDGFFEDVFPHVHINGTQDIIKQVNVALREKRPPQRYTRLLSPRKIDALFTEHSPPTVRQHTDVSI